MCRRTWNVGLLSGSTSTLQTDQTLHSIPPLPQWMTNKILFLFSSFKMSTEHLSVRVTIILHNTSRIFSLRGFLIRCSVMFDFKLPSPHRPVWEPACITLFISTLIGGQELLRSGNFGPYLIAGLSGLLEGKGVPAGGVTIVEYNPCKTTNNGNFISSCSCHLLIVLQKWIRGEGDFQKVDVRS